MDHLSNLYRMVLAPGNILDLGYSERDEEIKIKDTGAWLLASLPSGLVLNRESSCRQAVFTSRKGIPSSRVVGIETKVGAFLIQSYFIKLKSVSFLPCPVRGRAGRP